MIKELSMKLKNLSILRINMLYDHLIIIKMNSFEVNKIVAAIYRSSKHWKTNMALGGVAEPCKVTQEMEEMCIKAKNAVQGDIVGVDLMESEEKGLVVHEVNNTTEYKNTVRVCDVDIPSLMLDYALKVDK